MAAAAPAQQVPQYVGDANVQGVRESFAQFLLKFSPAGYEMPEEPMQDEDVPPAPRSFMALQVQKMCGDGQTTLYVEYAHLHEYSEELAEKVLTHYERAEPVLRKTLQDHVRTHHPEQLKEMHDVDKEFFIGITALHELDTLRDLKTEKIGKLVAFSGTVTRTTEVRPELFLGEFRCSNCATVMKGVEQQHKFTQPLICTNTGCNNKVHFTLNRDDSVFVDWQRVKVQENVDEIPGGSLPRMMDVILRSNTVDKAKPGDRVTFTGTLAVCPDVSVMSSPGEKVTMKPAVSQAKDSSTEGVTGLKTLGVREMTYKLIFMACSATQTSNKGGMVSIRSDSDTQTPQEVLTEYSEEDQEKVLQMAGNRDVFLQLARSVCPAVFGHEHIKQAILLMLLGGVHKRTKEGINLRGDINVAIIGDPSCAKSQLLKWVAGFLPRAVYTSGKASTAAGLTASVVKEPENNEFAIEAGALMLADNGICCIDEFDKMDSKDQVAIHEAMEQQTISIAKAGIQATLNARASILAAANPLGGRYDKSKPLKWNIALPPAILSRFDLLHVMIDETTEYQDERIAAHIVALHRFPGATLKSNAPFSSEEMQRYIRYARAIKPVISTEAQEALVKSYIRLRGEDAVPGSASAYRITVRQLEALVRLSEAMARAYCSHTILVAHVREASKLLQSSIMKIEQGDVDLEELLGGGDERDGAMEDWLQDHELPHAPAAAGANGAEPMEADAGAGPVQADDAENNPAAANQQQGQQGQQGPGGKADGAEGGKAAAVKISAEKYEYVKNMLLARLQQDQEEQAASEAAAAAASAMEVDGSAAAEAALQRAGMRQQDLAEWYMERQISRNAISTFEEGEEEYRLVFRVINHLIKKERLVTVLSAAVRRNEGEAEAEYRSRLWKERILALAAGYVVE